MRKFGRLFIVILAIVALATMTPHMGGTCTGAAYPGDVPC
ncbi:MAG: hypothetical protein K0R39_1327 [Symbiobacteriaceae bacterium]|jgi:hypothetical protein|nr:hypothetical protein [Symbiobacteriaceae bacterium]